MARVFYGKIISKASSVVADIRQPNYSDAVLHSKNLIDLLSYHALKLLNAPERLRFDRNITYEQKLEWLLDRGYISEKIFDNCLNTIGLRNPTEHIFTYPNEFYAKGAAASAFELFYALQAKLDLPQVTKVDALAIELGVQPLWLLNIQVSRYIGLGEIESFLDDLKTKIDAHSGPYTCLLSFPPGTTHPNGLSAGGITLKPKGNYSPNLRKLIEGHPDVVKTEWAGLEIIESLPHVESHNREMYPGLFPEPDSGKAA